MGTPEDALGAKPDEESLNDYLDRLNQRIGEAQRCPMCGGAEWTTVTGNAASVNVVDWPGEGEATLGSIRFALLYCQNCRFIRTHLLAP
ncbi:MAG: hypothetical protein M0027_13770 [Candidatus Dormibacteraeota bacterium]|jgi:hypothetical protein|nr:hypothetical protein [Candidatus Dormibacteraeota bacterium]